MVSGARACCNVVIRGRLAYFDTVCVWISRYLERWERDTLEGLCRCFIYRPALRAGDTDRWMWRRNYRVRLVLQGPSEEALRFLEKRVVEIPLPLINHVACALDFLTDTLDEAETLQQYVDAHLYKPYHRPEHGVEVYKETTTYLGYRNRRSKIVTYADKLSRQSGVPCTHLECRFQSAATVRALGIKSIADLLAFNHRTFWTKRLRLYDYDLERLGMRWNRRHLNHAPRIERFHNLAYNVDQRTGATLAGALAAKGDKPILMDLLDAARYWGRSLRRVLVRISAAELLGDLPDA